MTYVKPFACGLIGFVLAVTVVRPAEATIIFNSEDPPAQSSTPITTSFVATSSLTAVSFSGYQVPAYEVVEHIDLTLVAGGPELLGQNWAFTAASSGSTAYQFDDGLGSGVNGLLFAGHTEDSFDVFSQSVTTVAGQEYSLGFLFSNYPSPDNAPSELSVSVAPVEAPIIPSPPSGTGGQDLRQAAEFIDGRESILTPEPGSLALLVLGLASFAGMTWLRKRNSKSAFA